jgi:steroid delta-isomerase-like uncharacterized protein
MQGEAAVELGPAGVAHDFDAQYVAAWNSHDPDRLLALMTDDIVYDDDLWPDTMRGHADVREFLEVIWRAVPDLQFELLQGPYYVEGGKQTAMGRWRGWGTMTGPLDPPGFGPTGRRFEFFGADFHEYRDMKISRLHIIFDRMKIAQQLGLLPAAGSRGERAAARLQRLWARVAR